MNLYAAILFSVLFAVFGKIALAENSQKSLSTIAEKELKVSPSKSKSFKEPLATITIPVSESKKHRGDRWLLNVRQQKLQVIGSKPLEFVVQRPFSESVSPMDFYSFLVGRRFASNRDSKFSWALGTSFGMGRSDSEASLQSTRPISELVFQVLQGSVETQLRWRPLKFLALSGDLPMGVMNFTQASSNTSARFSETSAFLAPRLNLALQPFEFLSFGVGYENRWYPSQPDVATNAHNWLVFLEGQWQ